MKLVFITLSSLIMAGCTSSRQAGELHVAAAANLQQVFEPLSRAFTKRFKVKLIASYGSSSQLSQQIENGAPFDLLMSADTVQVERLVGKGLIDESTKAVYARGVLVLWAPRRKDIRKLEDLREQNVKKIGIASPELAPYGKAAIETLNSLHLWPELESKVVYAPNVSMVMVFAESGNADASFTALSLANERLEKPIIVPEGLHEPIDQSLGIIKSTQHGEEAAELRQFLLSPDAQAVFEKFGYRTLK